MTSFTKPAKLDPEEVAEAIGIPFTEWGARCHEISFAVVKSGLLEDRCRVARGWCAGVRSQHSWVVLGWDVYDPAAKVLDPTLWSYDSTVKGIWTGSTKVRPHMPHGGEGTIWSYGSPPPPDGEIIRLVGEDDLSSYAKSFLRMAGPDGLDFRGWQVLAHAPVTGWPAGEIIAAMYRTPSISSLVPIDIVGMVTDENPDQLYW